jgi:hypothetical protein
MVQIINENPKKYFFKKDYRTEPPVPARAEPIEIRLLIEKGPI